jgi:DNA-binding MarR family transcriptional regulator
MAAKGKSKHDSEGRFAYAGLDRAIHEKARLGILTSLAAHPAGLPFNELKELCALTDGNLNRHLAVLEEAKLITAERSSDGGRPQTTVVMTRTGQRRFQEYLNVLEQVLLDAAGREPASSPARHARRPGISPA